MDMNNVLLIMQAEQLGVKTCTVNFDYDKSLVAVSPNEQPRALAKNAEHLQDELEYADGKGAIRLRSTTSAARKAPNPHTTSQDYLYKTLVAVSPGDMVAVEARGQIRLAQVTDVHDEVDLSYSGPLSWIVSNLTSALATVKTHRAAERAAINKLSRGKAMREAREYMEDQKLGDFQLLDLIPHTPNETTKEALRESRGGNVDRVVDEP